jgi:hypothetical protein
MEWQGLKFVFGGDTYPNQWFVKYAAGAGVRGEVHRNHGRVPAAAEAGKIQPG